MSYLFIHCIYLINNYFRWYSFIIWSNVISYIEFYNFKWVSLIIRSNDSSHVCCLIIRFKWWFKNLFLMILSDDNLKIYFWHIVNNNIRWQYFNNISFLYFNYLNVSSLIHKVINHMQNVFIVAIFILARTFTFLLFLKDMDI